MRPPELPRAEELDEDGGFNLSYIDLGEKWSRLPDDVSPRGSELLPVIGQVLTSSMKTGAVVRWLVTHVENNGDAWLMPLDLVFFGPVRSRFNIVDSMDDSDTESSRESVFPSDG